MLMQFDPFREFDRSAEQLAAGARAPRPFPMAHIPAETSSWSALTCRAWTYTSKFRVHKSECAMLFVRP